MSGSSATTSGFFSSTTVSFFIGVSPFFVVIERIRHLIQLLKTQHLAKTLFLAYLTNYKPQLLEPLIKRRFALFWLGIFLVLPSIVFHENKHFLVTFGLTMNTLGFGAILLSLMHTAESDGLPGWLLFNPLAQMIASIGYFSYGIYVWHIDFAHIPIRFFYPLLEGMPVELSWIGGSLVYILLAVQTGVLMSKLIEIPILNLRDRLVPRTAHFEPLIKDTNRTVDDNSAREVSLTH